MWRQMWRDSRVLDSCAWSGHGVVQGVVDAHGTLHSTLILLAENLNQLHTHQILNHNEHDTTLGLKKDDTQTVTKLHPHY